MSFEESALLQRRYEAGLDAYTYLSRESDLPETGAASGNGQAQVTPPAPAPQPEPQVT